MRSHPGKRLAAVALALLAAVTGLTQTASAARPSNTATSHAASAPAAAAPNLQVWGNQLVDAGTGRAFQMRGVNKMMFDWGCVTKDNAADGIHFDPWNKDTSMATTIQTLRDWHVNTVRIPLNVSCLRGWHDSQHPEYELPWNAQANPPGQHVYDHIAYRNAVYDYVTSLTDAGFAVVLSQHLSENFPDSAFLKTTCAKEQVGLDPNSAVCPKVLPNMGSSVEFWTDVAGMFGQNKAVTFDLFNEPRAAEAMNAGTGTVDERDAAAWKCLVEGGPANCAGQPSAGLRQLLKAVRDAGADNVVIAEGNGWGDLLNHWLDSWAPGKSAPPPNLMASIHVYEQDDCGERPDQSTECYYNPWPDMAAVAAKVPLLIGEFGNGHYVKVQDDPEKWDAYCTWHKLLPNGTRDPLTFSEHLMDWADGGNDAHVTAGYLAWTFNQSFNSDVCHDDQPNKVHQLVTDDFLGTPTAFGQLVHDHLAAVAP
ncbi:MAG: cellulase family glycosylhydrolase [Catenulispora sp.]|nr:cellulase family glycosylhydrolase [Catenulispora sp.]NUR60998.1 cellulase family glycosylhydrolase [Catenulispora sp.]